MWGIPVCLIVENLLENTGIFAHFGFKEASQYTQAQCVTAKKVQLSRHEKSAKCVILCLGSAARSPRDRPVAQQEQA